MLTSLCYDFSYSLLYFDFFILIFFFFIILFVLTFSLITFSLFFSSFIIPISFSYFFKHYGSVLFSNFSSYFHRYFVFLCSLGLCTLIVFPFFSKTMFANGFFLNLKANFQYIDYTVLSFFCFFRLYL